MAVALAALYLLCHGLALSLTGQARLPSFLFLTGAPLLAALACLWRFRRGQSMSGWLAAALAMLLWAGGMGVNMYQEVWLGDLDAVPGASMLLYVLYGVPLTFTLARARQEPWYVSAIDATLAGLLGILFFAHTFSYAGLTTTDAAGIAGLRLMFDVENLFIAVFALVRYLAAEHAERRIFFGSLTLFSWAYFLTALVINHVASDASFGAYIDLLIDVPFLLLAILALRPASQEQPHVARALVRAVRAGRPLILPLSLLVVASLVVRHHPGLAVAGFVAATLGVGARSILQQIGLLERQEALDVLARVDPLTGVANRRQFDQTLQAEWSRARRSGQGMTLMLVDVDHFKQFNDRHGHQAGDRCLQAVAAALAACAQRGTDLVARYGGEEFAVVSSSHAHAGALELAERMRLAVQAIAAPQTCAPVTVSIGVAIAVATSDGGPEPLLSLADAALYEAKARGRNQVVERMLDHAGVPPSGMPSSTP